MENTNNIKKYGKEMLSYNDKAENYQGENELMVTITLNEYRALVSQKAETELGKIQRELWKKQDEIKLLNDRIKTLENLMMVKKAENVETDI